MGDSAGHLTVTCFQRAGNSVVDYAVVHQNIFDDITMITFFHVSDFLVDFKDHCMISFSLKVRFSEMIPKKTNCYLKTDEHFIWNKCAEDLFVKKMEYEVGLIRSRPNSEKIKCSFRKKPGP